MRPYLWAALVIVALSYSTVAQEPSDKSLGDAAREYREARLRKVIENTVNQFCSKADDPQMQQKYPKLQEKCKDKPALVQVVFDSALKNLKETEAENAKRLRDSDNSWASESLTAQTAPTDSVSAARYRAQKACNYGASAKPTEVLECAKAEGELETALRSQAATQSPGMNPASAMPGDYVISLTGTTGLPVTGTCSFAGKAESFERRAPGPTHSDGRPRRSLFVR